MPRYPKYDDPDFGNKIAKLFKKYKIRTSKKSMKDICFSRGFKLQKPQEFVAQYINPKTPYTGLLVYHRIGAGKTCSAVQIGEAWKKKRRIIVVTPASLVNNFRKELRSRCAGEEYISNKDRKKLKQLSPVDDEYMDIIKKSDKKIDKYYDVISYHRYVNMYDKKKLRLNNKILIVDEVQNMVSESGSFYTKLYNSIKKAKDLRVVLLSATPISDNIAEICYTMNLLLPKNKEFPKTKSEIYNMFIKKRTMKSGEIKYYIKNVNKFKKRIRGYISYFRGAPDVAFPEANIKYIKCRMSSFQFKSYKIVSKNEGLDELEDVSDIFSMPNNFFIGTRITSNIAFPSRTINKTGYNSLTRNKIKFLKRYSCKFYKMMKIIRKSEKEDGSGIFIYFNFKSWGGIETFLKIVRTYGYSDFAKKGVGNKRYAVLSGDTKKDLKFKIINTYNKIENKNGGLIKLIIGSSSVKEGVSLLRTNTALVTSPHWNISRLLQVFGRTIRFCSHKDVKKSLRHVNIYVFLATYPGYRLIDEHILSIANRKQKIISQFEKAMKKSAVDCKLNKEGNDRYYEDEIICD
jgi:superfamily II DNA or RNA helicase